MDIHEGKHQSLNITEISHSVLRPVGNRPRTVILKFGTSLTLARERPHLSVCHPMQDSSQKKSLLAAAANFCLLATFGAWKSRRSVLRQQAHTCNESAAPVVDLFAVTAFRRSLEQLYTI